MPKGLYLLDEPEAALSPQRQLTLLAMMFDLVDVEYEEGETERIRQEQLRRRTIEAIIEAGKPAHTSYTLRLEPAPA